MTMPSTPLAVWYRIFMVAVRPMGGLARSIYSSIRLSFPIAPAFAFWIANDLYACFGKGITVFTFQ